MSVSADPRIGSELLGYRIEALLGRGGMSVVYRAEDLRLKRKVALKLLAPELAEDERFRERFLRESELAASLDHPSIVPIYAAGEVDGQLYIAMRYVEGSDLKRLLKAEGALEPKRAVALLAQLADALDAAHARGLVHRDVKPSNALLDSADHAYLADFGLTKSASDRSALTMTGRMIGTVDYAAPEQIEGKGVDGRADVYSLGCLIYECLAGEVPFPRDSELAVLWAHVHEKPPTVPANPALDPVIAKALAKDPQKRYQSCGELVEAAREALGLHGVVVLRDRKPLLLAGIGAIVAAGALAAGLALSLGGGGAPKPDLTVRNDTLVRIDPKTNKVAAVIPVGRDPENISYADGTVWVYNLVGHTVDAVDARTSQRVGSWGITGAPPFSEFKHAIAADRGSAWVLSVQPSGRGILTFIRREFPSTREFPLPDDAVSIERAGGWIWVVTVHSLLRIDPRTVSITRTMAVKTGIGQHLSWVAVGTAAVWLADKYNFYRVDPVRMRLTGRAPLDCNYYCPAIAVGRGAVWIATNANQSGSARLLRIDPRTLHVTRTINDPFVEGGADLTLDGNTIWWINGDVIRRVDLRTSKIISTTQITTTGHDAIFGVFPSAVAAGGGSVWVSVTNGA